MFKTKNNRKKYRTKRRARKINSSKTRKTKKKKSISRRQKNKQPVNWKKVGVTLLIIGFLGLVVWVLFFSPALEIRNVKISGFDNQQLIITKVNKIKNSFIVDKIPKNNLILFPKTQLIKDITENNIEIKKVEVIKKFPDTLNIKINQRNKLFLWQFPDSCQLYDENGKEVKTINCTNNDNNRLTDICHNNNLTKGLECLPITTGVHKNDFTEDIIKEKSQLAEKIFNFLKQTTYFNSSVSINIPSIITGEINVKNSQYGSLQFDANNDIDKQLNTLKAFLEQKISLSELQHINYIDLRIKDKLIYKFKDEYNKVQNEENAIKNNKQETDQTTISAIKPKKKNEKNKKKKNE